MKKVLFIASECVPFIKTGGLADVVGSLPKCFDKKYFDVRVVLPKYMCMKEEYKIKTGVHYPFLYGSRLEKPVCGRTGNELRRNPVLFYRQ